MSGDATNSSKAGMECGRAARDGVLEDYLTGRLGEPEREEFEEHYFGCPRCFADLQTLQAVRDELAQAGAAPERTTIRTFPQWAAYAALAAAVVLAVVGSMLWRGAEPPGSLSQTTAPSVESQVAAPEPGQPAQSERPLPPEPSLEQLARLEPPPYEPLRLRGVADEATTRFRRGMARYLDADYRGAIAELSVAARLDPEAAHTGFFLGVSHLMAGEDEAGIERLRATIALGDSPYLEEAHWYLAKGLLRRKDFAAAARELKTVIGLQGSKSNEASDLLMAVQKRNGFSR